MTAHDVPARSVAATFGLKPTTAHSIWARHISVGDALPGKRGGSKPTKQTPEITEYVAALIEQRPDLTLRSISETIQREKQMIVSASTILRICKSIGFTFKLLRQVPESRNCPEVIEARYVYANKFLNDRPINLSDIVWADETGFNLHIRRSKGRSLRGQRATIVVPNSRGKNISVACAMSSEGLLYHQVQFGAYNSRLFADWIVNLGVIMHNRGRENIWVILDNVRFHHSDVVNTTALSIGITLVFLPAYSPMLNPIELLFSKWKTAMKTSAVSYSRENLLSTMETARTTITPNDCLGWIRECERNLTICLQKLPFY